MPSVLCLYLVNICLTFSISYILYRSLMAGWALGSKRGRGRLRKHGLLSRTRAPSTTSTVPAFTTPTTATTSTPPGHPSHAQEFVMIPNHGYVKSGLQPSFFTQPSLPPPQPLGGEACTSPIPGSTPSSTPSQPGSQGA